MTELKFPRRQITLFVPHPQRMRIDTIRAQLNPIQHALIAAHVTLCRDEETVDWSTLQARANALRCEAVCLKFGLPVRDGDLVYLPVTGSTDAFQNLRIRLMNDDRCRTQTPHITLIHPRNGTCADSDFQAIQSAFPNEFAVAFSELTFIEKQQGSPWRRVQSVCFARP